MLIFFQILSVTLLIIVFLFLFFPIQILHMLSPFSQNIRDLFYYKNLEKLYTLYLNIFHTEENAKQYKLFESNFLKEFFNIKKISVYLFDKKLEFLYPKYQSKTKDTDSFSIRQIKKARNKKKPFLKNENEKQETVSLNEINNPLVHSFVHNKMLYYSKEQMYYWPLSRKENTIGVIEIEKENEGPYDDAEIKNIEYLVFHIYLLEYFARQDKLSQTFKDYKYKENEYNLQKRIKEDEDLIRTARLSALGHMARGLAHEIKNPLTTIKLILSDSQKIEEEDVSVVKEEINRLDRLVGQFLSFARPRNYHFVIFNPNLILKEILYLFDKRFRDKKINVTQNLASMLPNVIGDIDSIKQVFINIIENAIDAVKNTENAEIDLTTKTRVLDEERLISISISDNGPGIKNNDIDSIFEPFFTKKEKGSGLGLALSHNIIKAHEGKISAKNNLNKGATFEILLKMAEKENRKVDDLSEKDIDPLIRFAESINEINLSKENIKQYLLNRKLYSVKILHDSKKIIAFVSAKVIPPEAEIIDIATLSNYRKRGLGRRLMTLLEGELAAKKVRRLFLEVRDNNKSAIAFYAALGYEINGRRKDYYGPNKSALLMKKDI